MTRQLTTAALIALVFAANVQAQDSARNRDDELTQRIRTELSAKGLSHHAESIRVETVNGMVVLKGTVPNAAEKKMVGEVATKMAPNVRNDLVVRK